MVTKAIPEGFHSVTPYLVIKGAAEAIEFYKRAFGAVETYRHNSPDGNNIVNAELKIGDSIIMLVDEFIHGDKIGCHSPKSIGGSAVTLHIYTEDVDRLFNQAVDAGATGGNANDGYVLGRQVWTISRSIRPFLVSCNTQARFNS
jgi:PhnB protein